MNIKLLLLMLFVILSLPLSAEEMLDYKRVVTDIPTTSKKFLKTAFSKEAIGPWMTIFGSTAVLFAYDEELLESSQRAGRDLGIGNGDATETIIEIRGQDILRLPTDTASGLYFLGDGWLHGSIAAGFIINGYSNQAARPYNTGLQLAHGMFVSTIFNQALKRSFGREDPNFASEKRGAWRPFPSFKAYNDESAKYDAMPSGHVMTATLMFTVVTLNYPEYAYLTWPVGITWITVLSFQMMNNGVHWASDYPLGIAMGYLAGKLAYEMVHPEKPEVDAQDKNKQQEPEVAFYPAVTPEGSTLNLIYSF
ncbi:MAG: phosphatase PAP2 family protein [Bdellovibrionales bacterium]|nr:phosphatase PAP2 family protein [Bdellovibrionales bacterium]